MIIWINAVMPRSRYTVILEEFLLMAARSMPGCRGEICCGAPLDEDGIKINALDNIPADLKGKGVTPKYIYDPDHPEPDRQHHAAGAAAVSSSRSRKYGVLIFEDEATPT